MARRSFLAVSTVLVGLAIPVAASPAHAADEASITHAEPNPGGVQLLVSVPEGSEVDLDSVSVTVDGAEAAATAVPAESTTAVERTTILVIDTSNSMRGERFEAAKDARSVASAPPGCGRSSSTRCSTPT